MKPWPRKAKTTESRAQPRPEREGKQPRKVAEKKEAP